MSNSTDGSWSKLPFSTIQIMSKATSMTQGTTQQTGLLTSFGRKTLTLAGRGLNGQKWRQPNSNSTPKDHWCWSVCSMVGAASVAMSIMGWTPSREHGAEILPEAVRTTRRNHPRHSALGDVKNIDADAAQRILDPLPEDVLLLLVAGTPCQDNSALKGDGRLGLQGNVLPFFWEAA